MLAQTFMSSRSLTQGLDVINMEPSAPGVRTSVINSYLSNTGRQNISNALASNGTSLTNATNALVSTDLGGVQGQGSLGAVSASGLNANGAAVQMAADSEVISPGIYSVIKNSLLQALNSQASSAVASDSTPPSSNINALLSNQVAPGMLVDAAGAQINAFVNSLIFTVQAQTDLSPQLQLAATALPLQGVDSLSVVNTVEAADAGVQSVGVGQVQNAVTASAQFIRTQDNAPALRSASDNGNSATDNILTSSDNYVSPSLQSSNEGLPLGATHVSGSQPQDTQHVAGSATPESTPDNTNASQNISNVQGWVVGRVYSSLQTMIENLAVNQAQNSIDATAGSINPTTAALDSLVQSANSLFASMGLSATVTASTLQTALADIQRSLMSAPSQGQWINVVA